MPKRMANAGTFNPTDMRNARKSMSGFHLSKSSPGRVQGPYAVSRNNNKSTADLQVQDSTELSGRDYQDYSNREKVHQANKL